MKQYLINLSSFTTLTFAVLGTQVHASQNLSNQVEPDTIEVAFVLDTTGSMASLIAGAKQKIWSIANTIVDINPKANIRMALVAYRDRGDDYVIKMHKMSDDIQGLYGNLIALRAAGGGDTPESVNEALDAAIDQIAWTKGDDTRRIVFLVGDAPPHMDYINAPKYPEVLKQASYNNITVHAVQAGLSNETKNIWKDIAQRGGGSYIPIPQDGGQISQIETPYDQQIIDLQHKLDRTIVPYGPKETQAALERKIIDKSSGSVSKRVDNSAFYSKREARKEVVTGGGDIVSAVRNEDVELEAVAPEHLPAPMQKMSPEEQKSYIADIIETRKSIEAEMSELVTKRDQYIIEAEKNSTAMSAPSFDEAVRNAL